MSGPNLLAQPVRLPEDPAMVALTAGEDPTLVAATHPSSSLAWALLAERALAAGHAVEGYAYARTGYHRGLDALRRNGWKGSGPIPWEHVPNRGFLRALFALQRAAESINETAEVERCAALLRDSDPAAVTALTAAAG